MYGFIVEKKIAAKDVDSLNRSAVCATQNVDGGNLVALAAGATPEAPYTATVPATGALTGLWMAYPPTEALAVWNGEYFAGLSKDPRAYTNIMGRPFDVFKPKMYDVIGFTKDCADDTLVSPVVGGFLGAKNGQTTLTYSASTIASATEFKITYVGTLPFPADANSIGMSQYTFVVAECVAE